MLTAAGLLLHTCCGGCSIPAYLCEHFEAPRRQALALLLGGGMALAARISAQQLTSFYLYTDFVVAASLSVCDQWGAIMARRAPQPCHCRDVPAGTSSVHPASSGPEHACMQFLHAPNTHCDLRRVVNTHVFTSAKR